MCYHAEFGRSRSSGTSVSKEIRLKNVTLTFRLSRSIRSSRGTDTDRSTTYDFLLTFHSNEETYRFRDKRRFQSKIAKFSHSTCILQPRRRGSLGIGYSAGVKKTTMMGLSGREKFDDIFSLVDT